MTHPPTPTPPPAEVRRARPEDAAACARVLRGSRAEAMPWLPVLHTPEEDLAYLRGVLAQQRTWVAEADGEVVGFASLDEAEGVLDHLYLDPGSQRRGIGSALLTTVRTAYDGPLELWVFADNTSARAFYAAHGGVELYATDGAGNEERTPDVRMRLPAPAQYAYSVWRATMRARVSTTSGSYSRSMPSSRRSTACSMRSDSTEAPTRSS